MEAYYGKRFWLNTLKEYSKEYGAEETGKAFHQIITSAGYTGAGYTIQEGESFLDFTTRFIKSEYKSKTQLQQIENSDERDFYRRSNCDLDRNFSEDVYEILESTDSK